MSPTERGAPAQSAAAEREIAISRVISAPRELVFKAFTQVRHLSQWWGPEGFTTVVNAVRFRTAQPYPGLLHRVLRLGERSEHAVGHRLQPRAGSFELGSEILVQ